MTLLEEGVQKQLVSVSADNAVIIYTRHNKKRNYNNPEEKVQANVYLKLVLHYGYKPERIGLFVPVTMGREKKEADIVVYNDDEKTEPHILVECKKQEVSEAEFRQAVEQAFSYAYAMPNNVKYIWVTSGIKNEYYLVNKQKTHAPRSRTFRSLAYKNLPIINMCIIPQRYRRKKASSGFLIWRLLERMNLQSVLNKRITRSGAEVSSIQARRLMN